MKPAVGGRRRDDAASIIRKPRTGSGRRGVYQAQPSFVKETVEDVEDGARAVGSEEEGVRPSGGQPPKCRRLAGSLVRFAVGL
jgi:hypothetical protein